MQQAGDGRACTGERLRDGGRRQCLAAEVARQLEVQLELLVSLFF